MNMCYIKQISVNDVECDECSIFLKFNLGHSLRMYDSLTKSVQGLLQIWSEQPVIKTKAVSLL